MRQCNPVLCTAGMILLCVGYATDATAQDEVVAPPSWTQHEQDRGYVVFEHTTMAGFPDHHVPARNAVVKKLSCVLARGEYESLQIGVHALADDVKDIRITVTSDLEVHTYHRIRPADKKELASRPDEMKELARWHPSAVLLQRGSVVERLRQHQSVNFWVTFRADDKTRAGLHRGKVTIRTAGRAETVLDLEVNVRPFRLQTPRAAFGLYFEERLLPSRGQDYSADEILAMFRDIVAHGHNSLYFYPAGSYKELPPKSTVFSKQLPLAKQAGLFNDLNIPSIIVGGIGTNDEQNRAALAWLQAEGRKQGWPEMVQWDADEPKYPWDEIRDRFEQVRALPARFIASMSLTAAAYGHGAMFDVVQVMDGGVTPELQAEAERMGSEVWTYSFRIRREGFYPFRSRYYAGLYTWAHKLGGNYVWAYHHGAHSQVWFAPDSLEPMPGMGWEARREGIDDYRYLQMLEDCVTANPDKPLAFEAAAWLEALRVRIVATNPIEVKPDKPLGLAEYDEIRARSANYVQALGPVPEQTFQRRAVPQLKDEAAAYRGKSVAECIAGLGSADMWQRRAAAWGLYELGRQAEPATELLAQSLDDPEVRMPALHALEAIGPGAFRAVPKITLLLQHADSYVRTGAVMTLGEIGCPMVKRERDGIRSPSPHAAAVIGPLVSALQDDHPEIVSQAAGMLSVMGPLGKPAVPEAIKMLDDPDEPRWRAAIKLITGLGPEGAPAASKLAELHESKPGDEDIINALAAIGPAAAPAIPALEKYVAKGNPGRRQADSYHALFCIRGEISDLRKMVGWLTDANVGTDTRKHVAEIFERLGTTAGPVADEVRRILEGGEPAKETAEKRESGFGATPPAEAHYVDGADCRQLVGSLKQVATLPLDGWLFKADPKRVGVEQGYFKPSYPTKDFARIRVGAFWDDQGYKGLGAGWYRLAYQCPDLPAGKRVYLHFESVDETACLYIDGKRVAWYDTAHPNLTWKSPFLLDVTGSLNSGGTHLLAIRVGNESGLGGIYRPVSVMVEK